MTVNETALCRPDKILAESLKLAGDQEFARIEIN